jgi:hypothetical protein
LQAAHTAGLVHRDIKPGNVLVSRSGRVKITDFGIARTAESAPLTRPGVLMGTPAYLAPERAAGAPGRPAADLYALGVVAYQCLTGTLPFHGEPLAVALAHQQRPLPPLPPQVPAAVAALVADLTAKDPAKRPASAGGVAERAERVQAELTATATAAVARGLPARARAGTGTDTRPSAKPPPGRRATDGAARRRQNRRRPAQAKPAQHRRAPRPRRPDPRRDRRDRRNGLGSGRRARVSSSAGWPAICRSAIQPAGRALVPPGRARPQTRPSQRRPCVRPPQPGRSLLPAARAKRDADNEPERHAGRHPDADRDAHTDREPGSERHPHINRDPDDARHTHTGRDLHCKRDVHSRTKRERQPDI